MIVLETWAPTLHTINVVGKIFPFCDRLSNWIGIFEYVVTSCCSFFHEGEMGEGLLGRKLNPHQQAESSSSQPTELLRFRFVTSCTCILFTSSFCVLQTCFVNFQKFTMFLDCMQKRDMLIEQAYNCVKSVHYLLQIHIFNVSYFLDCMKCRPQNCYSVLILWCRGGARIYVGV